MILVLGSSGDRAYPRFVVELRERRQPCAIVNEDRAGCYHIEHERSGGRESWRIFGDGCTGSRPVASIFVRNTAGGGTELPAPRPASELQSALNRLLLSAICPVINPPANGLSNCSRSSSMRLLRAAGFDVPQSIVAHTRAEAQRFYQECGGRVVRRSGDGGAPRGQLLTPNRLLCLDLAADGPAELEEYVPGTAYRVHVVGEETVVSRLAPVDDDLVVAEPADLPANLLCRCVQFTLRQGLILAGFDFKQTPEGRIVALGVTAHPHFTFYEDPGEQPITRAVVQFLARHGTAETNVFA